jgi:hypothetical protein
MFLDFIILKRRNAALSISPEVLNVDPRGLFPCARNLLNRRVLSINDCRVRRGSEQCVEFQGQPVCARRPGNYWEATRIHYLTLVLSSAQTTVADFLEDTMGPAPEERNAMD